MAHLSDTHVPLAPTDMPSGLASYSPRLRQAAEQLSRAACVSELRAGVGETRRLWQYIGDRLDTQPAAADSPGHPLTDLRRDAGYVLAATEGAPVLDDVRIETMITLTRRAADLLAAANAPTTDAG